MPAHAALASSVAAPDSSSPPFVASDPFTEALERGPLYAAFAALIGGFLVSLTPCVYPMIAITVSVFGARQSRSRLHAMGLSTSFVLGIAAMFTPLGVAAGLTGNIFGSLLSNHLVVALVALVFLALAASMLGAFELVLPSSLTNRAAQIGGIGFGGAFLLGLVSGIIAAPCTGPVLTGILLWIGRTQSAGLGALALFAFSIGLGIPFWVVGTFAIRLPKSGPWTLAVKTLFGIVLAVVGLRILQNALPILGHLARPQLTFVAEAASLVVVGTVLRRFGPSAVQEARNDDAARRVEILYKARKSVGVVCIIAGLFLLAGWLELPRGALAWGHSEPDGRDIATREHRPMLIDFTATWCGACGELSRHTFADRGIIEEASRFVAVKVDATDEDDSGVRQAKDRYHVVGLPTVVLLGSDGIERRRFTEFVEPDRFLEALKQVQ